MSVAPAFAALPPPPAEKRGWPWRAQPLSFPPTRSDGSPWPRLTLVTPSYQQGEFLEMTIRSVLLQGYPNLDYWVIDGGSTDESVAIIERYAPWLTGWVSEADQGQAQAINKGFHRATGEWLGWINSDDYYAPGALYQLMRAAQRPGANFVQGDCIHFGPALAAPYVRQPLPAAFAPATLCLTMEFDQAACLWSRSLFAACGPLDEGLHFGFDWEFFIKCAPLLRLASVTHPVAYYRHHASHKSGSGGWRRTFELITIYERHAPWRQRLALQPVKQLLRLICTLEGVSRRTTQRHLLGLCRRVNGWLWQQLAHNRTLHPYIHNMLGTAVAEIDFPVRYFAVAQE